MKMKEKDVSKLQDEQIRELVVDMCGRAKKASRKLAVLSTEKKNNVLLRMADLLMERQDFIRDENEKDLAAGRKNGLSDAMLDRLTLSDKVLVSITAGLREVVALPDPVGAINEMVKRPNGLLVGRMRIPLGVIGMIYESRPNVTVDAAALCLKSGNCVLLRGGKEAIHSNIALATVLQEALQSENIDEAVIQVLPLTDRHAVNVLLEQEDFIDLIIPRGGEGLIRFVAQNSRIPVLKHYKGVCHVFVDRDASIDMAVDIVMNSKVQRPGVCNSLETLLVHKDIAAQFLPEAGRRLESAGVEIRGCGRTCQILPEVETASDSDWGREFLDLILAVKVVDDLDAALDHIACFGSQHTESIVTNSYGNGQRFLKEVDASAVMINASTRFSDGGEFGLGMEIGISTTKLHAYGPMGLKELTSQKFIVFGDGQIRN